MQCKQITKEKRGDAVLVDFYLIENFMKKKSHNIFPWNNNALCSMDWKPKNTINARSIIQVFTFAYKELTMWFNAFTRSLMQRVNN